MAAAGEGTVLWVPSAERQAHSNLAGYLRWLEAEKGLRFSDYNGLWHWSVTELPAFWESIWDYFRIMASQPYTAVIANRKMPGARWFVGAHLNYAEHIFRNATLTRPALVWFSEAGDSLEVSWADLRSQVAAVAAALRNMGVGPGDRVAAYLPNIPEAMIAFLACASIGAIWSSCSPDFGVASVLDRFRQIAPKVLLAADGYWYGGKPFDRRGVVAELQRGLPTLERVVRVPYLDPGGDWNLPGSVPWVDLLRQDGPLAFTQVPFDHPLWILYSSGTTGRPKAIVHGHGGILVEHLKNLSFHFDLTPDDRYFWFTTTGWMMWNFVVSGLLLGATVVLYDGSPGYPHPGRLWELAERAGITTFGTSAAYITACMKAGVTPGRMYDLDQLRTVGSTGSPLPPESFWWVYEQVGSDVWLVSASGGTDICSGFVSGCPLLPVRAGEIQCRCLGAKVEAFDEAGRSLVEQVGELVVTEPMPSMPLYFWNDPGDTQYRESYFDTYPGIWRHGDWIKITTRGSVVIYGRSDAAINRMGVRFGTSEIYRAVEELPEILDSLAVDLSGPDRGPLLMLFVVLREGAKLDDALQARIREHVLTVLSPRHVPDVLYAVPEIPRTLNGKKLEVPIKKILLGVPVEAALNRDSVSNPFTLQFFVELASKLKPAHP